MKVLLVWEMVPETVQLFLLEGEVAETAIRANGCYVNMVDGDPDGAADALNVALEGIDPLSDDTTPLVLDGPTTVVRSGFYL